MIGLVKSQAVLAGLLLLGSSVCWADTSASTDWRGLYVGANAGWVGASPHTQTKTEFNTAKYFNVPSDEDDVRELGNQRLTSDHFTGGGQIGYNWQSGLWILGLETDFNAFNTDSSTERSKKYVSVPTSTLTMGSTTQTDWLWTLRPRLGYATKDGWLFYGTGGLTVADLAANFTLSDDNAGSLGNAREHQHLSKTKMGWTVGGGIEVALDKNWSVRSEYLFADLGTLEGSADDLFTTGGYQPNTLHREAEFEMHLVRFSLNYRF